MPRHPPRPQAHHPPPHRRQQPGDAKVVGGEATSAGRPSTAARTATVGKQKPNRAAVVAQTTLASARQWCGSKGAYNRSSYPCHYCTYRGGLLRQGAVNKAKADDQRHAGEPQHHHIQSCSSDRLDPSRSSQSPRSSQRLDPPRQPRRAFAAGRDD